MCEDAEEIELVPAKMGYHARCKGCGKFLTLSETEQTLRESSTHRRYRVGEERDAH